jgi:hypothetical protein
MANEAVCIETPTKFTRRTVADGTAIPLGTILLLSDPNTASATTGNGETFGGIAWEEKKADDGLTQLTAAMDGVWDLKDSGSGVTVGSLVSVGGANTVKLCTEAELITGDFIGKAEETASASEVFRVRVGSMV